MGPSEQEEIHYTETNSTYKFSITGKYVRVFQQMSLVYTLYNQWKSVAILSCFNKMYLYSC
jgi:hypothetical protein